MTLRAPLLALVVSCASAPLASCIARLDVGNDASALSVFVGPRNGCVLDARGELRCAGSNEFGELGTLYAPEDEVCGAIPCRNAAVRIVIPAVRSVAIGHGFLCATVASEVFCWGANRFGTLGRGGIDTNIHPEPMATDALGGAQAIAAGRHHVCAARLDGTVVCWGLGNHGELGRDPETLDDCGTVTTIEEATSFGLGLGETIRCASTPLVVPTLEGVTRLRTGPFASCFGSADTLRCAGRNVDGSLGVGAAAGTVVAPPTALVVNDVVDVAIGLSHGCAVDALHRVFCFGHHDLGQLGVGADTAQLSDCGGVPCATSPIRLVDAAPAAAVVAGDEHTCLQLVDATVRCFGSDAFGEIGDSDAAEDCGGVACARTPRAPVFLEEITSMVAAGHNTFVITGANVPMTVGANTYGQRSRGSPSDDAFPSEFYGIPR